VRSAQAQRFDWCENSFFSLAIGFLLSIALFIVALFGGRSKLLEEVVGALLWPGAVVATWVFGGLHGGKPLLLLYMANGFVYGALCLLILWLSYKLRSKAG